MRQKKNPGRVLGRTKKLLPFSGGTLTGGGSWPLGKGQSEPKTPQKEALKETVVRRERRKGDYM